MRGAARLQRYWPWLGVALCLLGAFIVSGAGPFSTLQLQYFDYLLRHREARAYDGVDEPIVLVGYDNESATRYGPTVPRGLLGKAITHLRDAGARVIVLDFLLSDPDMGSRKVANALTRLEESTKNDPKLHEKAEALRTELDDDRILAEALRSSPVVEAYANINVPINGEPAWKRIPEREKIDVGSNPASCADAGPRSTVILDEPSLFDAASVHASALISPDGDGVLRRYPLFSHVDGSEGLYPSLALLAAEIYLGQAQPDDDWTAMVDCDHTIVSGINLGARGLRPVTDANGHVLIDYGGTFAQSFGKFVKFYQLFETKPDGTPAIDDARFAGKVVFLGSRSDEVDKFTTPFETTFSGFGLHAIVARSLIKNEWLRRNSEVFILWEALGTLIAGILGILLVYVYPRTSAPLFGVYLALPLVGHYAAVEVMKRGWLVDFFWPALFASIGFIGAMAVRFFAEQARADETKKELGSFLSPEVVEVALRDPNLLAPARRDLSILFSDIRGFTTTAEGMQPEALAALLEGYLTRMTQIVFEQKGTLDKYIGDAVMALFGAPKPFDEHPVYACRAALAMMDALAEMQKEWHAKGQPILDIGIGVNTGIVAVGRMGSRGKAEYTCLGDEVNFASRLEGLNKAYGTHVLVGEATRERAGDLFLFRDLGLVQVKGKKKATRIYELLSTRPATIPEWIATWDEGLAAFLKRDWDHAEIAFKEVIRLRGEDNPSFAFLEFIRQFRSAAPPADWQGTIERHEK